MGKNILELKPDHTSDHIRLFQTGFKVINWGKNLALNYDLVAQLQNLIKFLALAVLLIITALTSFIF